MMTATTASTTCTASPTKKRRIDIDHPQNTGNNSSSNSSSNTSNIRVVTRVRPFNQKELQEHSKSALFVEEEEHQIRVQTNHNNNSSSVKSAIFQYDTVLNTNVSQADVYDKVVGKNLIRDQILRGFNVTILAYGQTGSGKTFTMGTEGGGDGSSEIGTSDGIIPRVVYDLFQCVRQYNETHADKSNGNSNSDDNSGNKVKIDLSYLEIYNEECRDLLVTSNNISDHKDLVLRESSGNNGAGGGVHVVGLSRVSVTSPQEVAQYMQRASERRVTGSTKMNSTSSRSHAICTIQVTLPNITSNDDDKSNNDDDGGVLTSKLTLVDLAGSERIKRTGAEGHRLKEGININKGLFVLGQVVSALSEMGASSPSSSNSNSSTSTDIRETNLHQHVPYRDSKLTRLLQDSLGGNSRTILVACVSPADTNVEETMNTLRYAERARNIKNSAVRNLVASSSSNKAEVKMLRKENQVLRMQLSKAQETIRQFSKLSGMNSMAPPLATNSSSFHTSNESTSIVNRNSSTSVNMIPDVFTDENMISSNKNNENMKLQMTCIALQTKLKGTNDRLQRVTERVLQESNRADHYQVQYDGLFHAILRLDKKDHEGQQQQLPLILSQYGKQIKMKNSDKKSLVEHQREEIESLKEQLYESRVDVNVLRATAAILMRQHQKNTTENDKNTNDEENVNLLGFSLAQNHDDKNDSDSYSDLSVISNVVEDMTVEFSTINADIERKEVMVSQLTNEGRCFDETMRNQFETTIQNLNKEIEVLSSERNQLMQDIEQQQQSTSSTNKVAQNEKQPKLLRERIASLENKIKSLKSKSADHTRVLREREIAQRKCAQLQLEIADDKRRRVSLQRKLKEEATERKNERAEARKEATRLVRDGNRLKMEISKIKETAAKQAAVLRRKAAEASAKLKTETEKKKRQQLANETKSSLSITQYQKENVLNWLEREIQIGDTIKSTKIQLDEEKEFLGIAKDKKNNLLTQQERGNYVIKELQIVNDEITARSMAINHLQRTLDEITSYSKDSDVSFMNKKIWESLSRNELRFSLLNLFELLVMSKIELNDLRNKADERVLVAVNNAVQDEKRKSQETLLLLKMEHSESMMTLLNTTKDALSQKFKDDMFLVSNTSNIEQHTKTVIDKILEPYFLGCDKIGTKLHHDLQEVKDAQNGMKLLYDQLSEGVIMKPKPKKKKDRESVDHDLMEKLFEDDVPEGYDSDDSDWSPTSPAKSKKAKKIDIKKLQPSEISTTKHTIDPFKHMTNDDCNNSDEVRPKSTLDLQKLKVAELKILLREQNLSTGGRKSDLIERLNEAFTTDIKRDSHRKSFTSESSSSPVVSSKLDISRTPLRPIQQNKSIPDSIPDVKGGEGKAKNSTTIKSNKSISSGRKRRRNMNEMLTKTLAEVENALVI